MENKPFSQSFVICTTAKHMRKAIDVSISKTFDRMTEFADNPAKSMEIFETQAKLHAMRKQIDDFQLQHKDSFKGS